MNLWETLFDAAQHLLVPIDLEIWMQPALHQHSGAAEFDGLFYLVVDIVEVENVALFGLWSFQRPVKGAESAVFGAKVRVINVAVDDVRDHPFGVELAPLRVGFHTQPDQVI